MKHTKKGKICATLARLGAAVSVALLATSAYWIKVVTEQSWMRNTKFWKDSHFDFHYNFLLTTPWFDERNLWFFDLLFLLILTLIVGSTIYLRRQNEFKIKPVLLAVLGLFSFADFMTTVVSQPIWEVTPFLKEVQFPWRWMTIASVSGSIIASTAAESIWKAFRQSGTLNNSIKVFGAVLFISYAVFITLIAIDFPRVYIPSNNFDNCMVAKSHVMGARWFWTTESNEQAFNVQQRVIAIDGDVKFNPLEPSE